MTSKELAHALQLRLQADVGKPVKKGHVYELLAAAFGYKSHASFISSSVLAPKRSGSAFLTPLASGILNRFESLAYPANASAKAAAGLVEMLRGQEISAISLESLVRCLRQEHRPHQDDWAVSQGDDDDDSDFLFDFDDDFATPLLLDGLNAAADKDNALAHFALALIYMIEVDQGNEAEGSQYWHLQRQQGHELSETAKAWAQAYEDQQSHAASLRFHLQRAAALGLPAAMLEMADRFDDASFFEAESSAADLDPNTVAEIAAKLGRPEDVHKWLTRAAESGDTNAMRELIENHDHADLQRCWKWLYLAEALGTDLTDDQYVGIHEDGSPFDDDVGGPIYADGRDGVSLQLLIPEQELEARTLAQSLFSKIKAGRLKRGVDTIRFEID